MKFIITALTTILMSSFAVAEVPSYTCSYQDIAAVASYDGSDSQIKTAVLSETDAKALKMAFDDAWNCNEGVELMGAQFDYSNGKKVVYQAQCSVDSLGTATVQLPLTCEETYLN